MQRREITAVVQHKVGSRRLLCFAQPEEHRIFDNDVAERDEGFQRAGGMDRGVRQDAAAGDAIGSVSANDDRGLEDARIGIDNHGIRTRFHSAGLHTFANLDAREVCLRGQPGIEFVAPDDAEGVCAARGYDEALAREIEVRFGRVDVGDFRDIQSKALKENFGIACQPAGAELVTRVAGLLEDKDARRQLGRQLREMERSGEASRSAAEDEDVWGHA